MDTPLLSVVIVNRNRRELLGDCLQSLVAQTLPAEQFEVLVCDDGTEDATRETLHRDWRLGLRVLRADRRDAFDLPLAEARASICLILDEDIIGSPELLAQHLQAHRRQPRLLGIGRVFERPSKTADWYARMVTAAATQAGDDRPAERAADWTECCTGNLSIPVDELRRLAGVTSVGVPPERVLELGFRRWQQGCSPRHVGAAQGTRTSTPTRSRLLRDARVRGRNYVALSNRQPAMLPKLLGCFLAAPPRELMLRRLILAVKVSPGLLARLGPLIPGSVRQESWFAFVGRLAFWAGVRNAVSRDYWGWLTAGVPVLLYHAFAPSGPSSRYVVNSRAFRSQLRLLRLLRFRVISFQELAETLHRHELPPAHATVITIDDGYEDNLTVAAPILRRHGATATVYLVSQRLTTVNDWAQEADLAGRALLGEEHLDRMPEEVISFGGHADSCFAAGRLRRSA